MGLGFKDWAAGDIPTAAEFDGYLQRQTVMVFASTSARDTALSGNLEEGMVAYNSDADQLWVYNGSAWLPVASTRTGCSLARSTNQTLASSTSTDVTYTAETADVGGFYPGSGATVTVPSNLGGLYSISFTVKTSVGSSLSNVRVDVDGSDWIFSTEEGAVSGSRIVPLAAGAAIKIQCVNGATAGNIESAELHVYRIGA